MSWITGHLAPLPLIAFHPPKIFLRMLAILGLATIISVGICREAGILADAIAGVIALATTLMFIVVTILLFHKTSEWRSKHEKRLIFKERRAESIKAAQEVSKSEHARRDLDSREQKTIEKITKEAEKAKASELSELADVDRKLASQLKGLEKQKQKLQSSETNEIGHALRILQQQHIANYLSRASIGSAKIPGIGPGVVRSLAACGIHNAADFSGLQYRTGPRGGQQVYIVGRNNLPVHPSGVGEKKARDLDNWRRGQEATARATQPSSLPAAQAQAIRARYTQQRQVLADQEQAVRAQAADDRSKVAQKWIPMHVAISAKIVPARQEFAQARAQIDLNLSMTRKQANVAVWQRDLAKRELAAYRNVSYRRYLAGAIRP